MKYFRLSILVTLTFCVPLWASPTIAVPQSSKEWVSYLSGPDTTHDPIIFVHGITGGFEKWDPIAQLISDHQVYSMRYLSSGQIFHNYMGGRPKVWVWNVSYYTPDVLTESINGNLTLYAQRLDQMIQTISKITGKKKVVLVAHSMGGLIARKYIVLRPENAERVSAILTVGTPHSGVDSSIPIVGQLQDLETNSLFIKMLDKEWSVSNKKRPIRWGVIGGVVTSNILPNISKFTTDLGGPGFIAIQSAIPFGEWENAVKQLGKPTINTSHFGFRAVVVSQHEELLTNPMTLVGIAWATAKNKGKKVEK